MPQHDFTELYDRFPNILAQMPEEFSSHDFIKKLAQEQQKLYIEALYAYRESKHRGGDSPFRVVHGILAQHLSALPELVSYEGEKASQDIFGQSNECALWRKTNA